MQNQQLKALITGLIIAGDWANPGNYDEDKEFASVDQAVQIAEMIMQHCGLKIYSI